MSRFTATTFILAAFIGFAGFCSACAGPSSTYERITTSDGSESVRIESRGERGAVEPATFSVREDGASGSSGAIQALDQAIAQLWWLPFLGGGLILLGLGTGIAHMKGYKVMSITASIATAVVGVFLVALPKIVSLITLPVVIAGVLGLLIVLYLTGGLDNLISRKDDE